MKKRRKLNQVLLVEICLQFLWYTTVCEAMVVIIRFVDDSWTICQRVIRLMLLASSLKGVQIARQLNFYTLY